jgi:hypothetical protein
MGESNGVGRAPEARSYPQTMTPGRWPHLAFQEAPNPVEVRIVVITDDDLQPADANLGVH